MANPFGWGTDEPQIKPKDQGGDTIATFAQKVYNLFDKLFDTLNSYPWSTATHSDAGYMSATDKETLDNVATTYLPLSGGTMSGTIAFSGNYDIRSSANDKQLSLLGGMDANSASGAKCLLNGASYTNPGWFTLQAGDGNGYKQLVGKPDGGLTWDASDVVTLAKYALVTDAESVPRTTKLKLPNGGMVIGAYGQFTTDSDSKITWTYPEAFMEIPYFGFMSTSSGRNFTIYSQNTSRLIMKVSKSDGTLVGDGVSVSASFIAFGRWA